MMNQISMTELSREELFTFIYRRNAWGGEKSVSGPGSDHSQTQELVNRLPTLFKDYNVEELLDIPCGDFHWMANVDLDGIEYTGGDIVADVINANKVYERKGISFRQLDIVKDALPAVELIICRDCLVHFSVADIYAALRNICKSSSQYLLTTTFTSRLQNYEIYTGQWRPLNLQIPPFNFPDPVVIINEKCTEGSGIYSDKSLGLWKIADIRQCLP